MDRRALLIALAAFLVTRDMPFPDWRALLPVAGATLLIAAGNKTLLNRYVLANPAMVGVGLTAVAFYVGDYYALQSLTVRQTTPNELAAHSCITFEGLASLATWTFLADKAELTVPIRSRLQVNTAEAAIDAAIAGVGMTRVLSYQISAAVRSGVLHPVLETFEQEPWPANLVHAGQADQVKADPVSQTLDQAGRAHA